MPAAITMARAKAMISCHVMLIPKIFTVALAPKNL